MAPCNDIDQAHFCLKKKWCVPSTCDSLMAGRFSFGFWCWWALANLARCGKVYVQFIIIIKKSGVPGRLVLIGTFQFGHGVGGFKAFLLLLIFLACQRHGVGRFLKLQL